jgi:Tfp pilus assembly protein PilV
MTKIKPIYKKLLWGLLISVLAIALIIWYIFNEKFEDTSKKQAEFTIAATDLLKEFQQNDSLANKKYTEKILAVSGIVSQIETADTTANVKFSDSTTGNYIIFAFQQQDMADAKKLQKGQSVTIKGSCSGGVYSEILGINYVSFKRSAINK